MAIPQADAAWLRSVCWNLCTLPSYPDTNVFRTADGRVLCARDLLPSVNATADMRNLVDLRGWLLDTDDLTPLGSRDGCLAIGRCEIRISG